MHRPSDILGFWFDGASDHAELGRGCPAYTRWFGRSAELDAHIVAEYGDDVEQARAGVVEGWRDEPRTALALILLLDQFPRHVYRGSAEAFGSDAEALAVATACIDTGMDEALSLCERVFLYLPVQHSERLQDHDLALRCFTSLVDVASASALPILGFCRASVTAELEHIEVLRRFGRYPYRNAALGRASTPAEAAWLAAEAQ
jgi:uncharacterized protein (DUF924 family)